ncbi:hypothetical protein ACDY96_13645, partial [Rhizobium mongolense]|uniref:hypothetical protein n=1 Tax=Rhizobium mongolense TaxID=57676 RepID=UPI003557B6E3
SQPQSAIQPIRKPKSEGHRRQQRRRPRSVTRLIRLTLRHSQQAFLEKNEISLIPLISKRNSP